MRAAHAGAGDQAAAALRKGEGMKIEDMIVLVCQFIVMAVPGLLIWWWRSGRP